MKKAHSVFFAAGVPQTSSHTTYNYTLRAYLSISEHKFFSPAWRTCGHDLSVETGEIEKPDPRLQYLASEEGDELVIISAFFRRILLSLPIYNAAGSINNVDDFLKNKYIFIPPSYLFYLQ
jgi:hypothetical protein